MSRYTPVSAAPSSPVHSTHSRRPSFSFRSHSRRSSQMPDPDEMDAAFDGPDDTEDTRLLARDDAGATPRTEHVPGDYDFDRDYFLPPSSPPPFQPYSAQNPAPGNTNGVIPTSVPARPAPPRHFLGGILPTALLPRHSPSPAQGLGGGQSGVFANLAARPDGRPDADGESGEGPDWVPEESSKDAPPSYQTALRDAVPPYWDTTVVLPSSSSPFGPLSSSISGDDVLIDGMPSGNFFGFFWNLLVSVSFQFVGFLLTYVLHTTHAAKYGSRAGLGLTLIQFGFSMRSRAEQMIETGHFPGEANADSSSGKSASDIDAENVLSSYWGTNSLWPQPLHDPAHPDEPAYIAHNADEAERWAYAHNTTLAEMIGMPSAVDVGHANEWFSFILMTIGWFLVITSVGQWWRIKRFERKLRLAQRESEAAQAAATNGGDEGAAALNTSTAPAEATPLEARYYTAAFTQVLDGARDLRAGFFGHRGRRFGRPGRGAGHTPISQDDEGEDGAHELLDAQGFGLGTMADEQPRRGRGLWGV
ncbi:hypothetical protein Q5752_001720 [Cryptotrichosporon argae]